MGEKLGIYKFGTSAEGSAEMKNILGGKGANLAEMVNLGLPVPPGFTIPCEASIEYMTLSKGADRDAFKAEVQGLLKEGMSFLKHSFGVMPLVSVRSGARDSMPGMMDTILNVGLTSKTLPEWIERIGKRAALDSYRRLIQMYGNVAMGVPMEKYDAILDEYKKKKGVAEDFDLPEESLERLIGKYLQVAPFPDTVEEQLNGSVLAVFKSWMNPRAVEYRKINKIPDDWGTAVNVQAMVFGNMDEYSATGVLFTRDHTTGEKNPVGEYLVNSQGEDVVAGLSSFCKPIHELAAFDAAIAAQLFSLSDMLETHYQDMQEIEFTVESGTLFILQTRNAKRSPLAAFQIAYDLVQEGVISKEEALSRVSQEQLLAAVSDQVDPAFKEKPHFKGIPAGGGVVSGVPVFDSASAINCKVPCILIRKETDPDDIGGMNASLGILTATGGTTSHAAVVARGMGKTCVVGCTDLDIYSLKHGGTSKVTIDGMTGSVWFNVTVPVVSAANNPVVKTLTSWALGGSVVERAEINTYMSTVDIIKYAHTLSGAVYVDTALLEGPHLVVNMLALGNGLSDSKVEVVYVDMSGMYKYLSKSDRAFHWMFNTGSGYEWETPKVEALRKWPSDVMAKVIFKNVEKINPAHLNEFLSKGATVSGKIKSFEDLLECSGEMDIDDDVIYKVFGSKEGFEAASSMVRKKSGKALHKKAVPMYWYDFLSCHTGEAQCL